MTRGARGRVVLVLLALALGGLIGYVVHLGVSPAVTSLLGSWSQPFWLTLRIATVALVLTGVTGIAAGFALAKGRFPGRDLLEAIGSVPLILPPTVLGYYVLEAYGDNWFGRFWSRVFGQTPVQDYWGCVIVAAIAAFPFCLRATRSAIEEVDPRLETAARAMGLSEWRIRLQVTIPLARRGIGVGLTLAFLRAMGEFGATLMVGGSFPGRTRTLSIAVTDERTLADTHAVLLVLIVMAAIALTLVTFLQREPR